MATDLFSLGNLYVSDFLAPGEEPRADPFELRLQMNDDGLVHLTRQPPAELMWGERYWYRSGTNQTMRHDLADIVLAVERVVEAGAGDVWVDIASNDGTLLSNVNAEYRVGVDPADDSFAVHAMHHCEWLIREPFSPDAAARIVDKYGKAKVVTCIAMFYDLMDPSEFLTGVDELLADDGIFVLQLAYAPLMLRQLAFDAICHEHARYYSLTTLAGVLGRADFQILDVTLNDVNGGSMRVIAAKLDAELSRIGSQPWRDVGQYRTEALFAQELVDGVNQPNPWIAFWKDVVTLRVDVIDFLESAANAGKRVWGYGASTKGNTLLQFFGIDDRLVEGIAERQERKVGLRTIGTNIPIYSEADMRAAKPDYALVLPWQFLSEFRHREASYLAGGGRFVVPCPRFEIIGG